jgi:hypothetical protein
MAKAFSKVLAIAAAMVLTAAGCGSSSSGTTNDGGGGGTPAQGWTILVYMTADNNLEGPGMDDLIEMSTVGSGTDLRFVVQTDRAVGEFTGPVLNIGDFTTTKRFLVQKGSLRELEDIGEANMADPAVLTDFISWGVKTYPGQRYVLDLWDHGGGWRGFGWDDSTVTASAGAQNLTLAKLDAGIRNGLAAAGLAKFDILGFDACLMATVEVVNVLQGYANYLIVSEESEPGHGWDYAAFGGGGTLDPVALGKKVIDGFKAQAVAKGTDAGITLSLIDASKIPAVVAALTGVKTGYTGSASVTNQLGTARQTALAFADNPDATKAYNLVDVNDLLAKASSVTGGSTLAAAVSAAVVYHVEGAAKASAKGLAIYFPPTQASYLAGYDAIPGMDDWRTFLRAYYASIGTGAGSTKPAFVSGSGTLSPTHASVVVEGTVSASTLSSLVAAYIQYGLPASSGTGAYLFGDQPATLSGISVSATWDWTVLSLSQTTGSTPYIEYAYLSLDTRSSTLAGATIPLVYEPTAGQQVYAIRDIVYQPSTGTIVSDTLYADSGGGMAALTPVAGSKLRTLVGYLPDRADPTTLEWLPYSTGTNTGFDATKPMSIGFDSINTGATAFLGLRIVNGAGLGDWLYTVTGIARP